MINGVNTIVPLAHVTVKDRDYICYISMDTVSHNIHVFKYTDLACDYEVFSDYDLACDYLGKNLES